MRRMKVDSRPTEEEVERHNITHVPYRSWCKHCVQGKGKSRAHKRLKGRVRNVPTVSIDYGFMSSSKNTETEDMS